MKDSGVGNDREVNGARPHRYVGPRQTFDFDFE